MVGLGLVGTVNSRSAPAAYKRTWTLCEEERKKESLFSFHIHLYQFSFPHYKMIGTPTSVDSFFVVIMPDMLHDRKCTIIIDK